MIWLEQKYVMLLSPQLRNFRKKSNRVYNFSCPICGDSETNKRKARGYLWEKKGTLSYHCHNCGAHFKSFDKFLYRVNDSLYYQYKIEKYKEVNPQVQVKEAEKKIVSYDRNVFKDLFPISILDKDHYAKQYVMKRKIPEKYHDDLYFCPRYKTFVNSILPRKLGGPDNARLIIPFGWKGKLVAFLGRTLVNDNLRYSMIVLNEDAPHVFGIETVNANKKYYVVEGPFDSMFLDNSIAVSGSDLTSGVLRANINKDNAVLVYDNQPRNQEILKKINGAIENGFSVVVWPCGLEYKDINDMIEKGGYTSSEIQYIIDSNTHKGLAAKMAFTDWKRSNNV